MALLSFVDSTPRAYRLKAGNAAGRISTAAGTSPARRSCCLSALSPASAWPRRARNATLPRRCNGAARTLNWRRGCTALGQATRPARSRRPSGIGTPATCPPAPNGTARTCSSAWRAACSAHSASCLLQTSRGRWCWACFGPSRHGRRWRPRGGYGSACPPCLCAIALDIGENDPAAIVKGAMAPTVKGRQPVITDLTEARQILAAVEAIPAHPTTKLANRLLALTAVRPGELRAALWTEFDGLGGSEPLWRIPAGRRKMQCQHLVPLSRQAVAVLDAVRPLTGRCPLASALTPLTRGAAHRRLSR